MEGKVKIRGSVVRRARLKLGWSEHILSAKIGKDSAMVSIWETSSSPVTTLRTAAKLADVLGITLEELQASSETDETTNSTSGAKNAPVNDQLEGTTEINSEVLGRGLDGTRIVLTRSMLHLTQEELAKKIGMKPSIVSLMENGKHNNPPLCTATALAAALGVPLDVLLDKGSEQADILGYKEQQALLESQSRQLQSLTEELESLKRDAKSKDAQLDKLITALTGRHMK